MEILPITVQGVNRRRQRFKASGHTDKRTSAGDQIRNAALLSGPLETSLINAGY